MINILMVPSDYEMEIVGDTFFIQFFLNYIKLLNMKVYYNLIHLTTHT